MPEGDTIHRTAATLQQWVGGRTITAVSTTAPELRTAAARLVGDQVDHVSAQGKHLLMHLRSGVVVHTHMQMRGAWHVYGAGQPWARPTRQARLTIEAGDRVAVCFNAPVVEVLGPSAARSHAWLGALGPDVVEPGFDVGEVVRRALQMARDTPIGDVLLDQRVLAGVGNIWRSETLWRCRLHPATTIGSLTPDRRRDVVVTASSLLQASAGPGPRPALAVYRRRGRPCPRCGRAVRSGRVGVHARTAYWCPGCQPDQAEQLPG
jgi:endonuclease-8